MRKIDKIINITVIFMLIGVGFELDFAYSMNISSLRVPAGTGQTQARFKLTFKQVQGISSRGTTGIRSDDQGYDNEKSEYLAHLDGNFPESLERHSLDWPVDMTSGGYIWHFHGGEYRFIDYSSPRRHLGVDILFVANENVSIKAILDGKIIDIIYNGGRSYGILVRSENGLVCCYYHIVADRKFSSSLYYKPGWEIGQTIKKGQLIGTIAWCPRTLKDYQELDKKKKTLPFAGRTLATRLHFQTWYFSPNMSNDKVARHIYNRSLHDEGDENEFNPLLILKPLYSMPLLQETPGTLRLKEISAIEPRRDL